VQRASGSFRAGVGVSSDSRVPSWYSDLIFLFLLSSLSLSVLGTESFFLRIRINRRRLCGATAPAADDDFLLFLFLFLFFCADDANAAAAAMNAAAMSSSVSSLSPEESLLSVDMSKPKHYT